MDDSTLDQILRDLNSGLALVRYIFTEYTGLVVAFFGLVIIAAFVFGSSGRKRFYWLWLLPLIFVITAAALILVFNYDPLGFSAMFDRWFD